MTTLKLMRLLIVASSIIFIQSCKLPLIEPQCPTVLGLSPSAARFDDTVTITGQGFLPNSPQLYKVGISGQVMSPMDVPNNTTMRFKVPKGIGSGLLTVSLAGGTICNSASPLTFTYRLTITDVNIFARDSFNLPAGMAVDPTNNNVIVADRNNNVIRQIDNQGRITKIAGIKGQSDPIKDNDAGNFVRFYAPDDVAVDSTGNIYVADDFNHCIRLIKIEPGRPTSTILGKIRESGSTSNDGPLANSRLTRPRGVAIKNNTGGRPSVFTVEYTIHRLRYANFDLQTINTLAFGITSLKSPIRVAYSEKRNTQFPILIADNGNNRILEMNINGVASSTPISFPAPQDLEVDEFGNIIVLNSARKMVSIIYKDNSTTDIIGQGINYNNFINPQGLAIDTKNKFIYISDSNAGNVIRAKYQ